jgi:hypothetical protein
VSRTKILDAMTTAFFFSVRFQVPTIRQLTTTRGL